MQNKIVVVMPVRGRLEQTSNALNQLHITALTEARYIAVGGSDDGEIITTAARMGFVEPLIKATPRLTYWQGLDMATQGLSDSTLVATVANDVLPVRGWLKHALTDWHKMGGVIGFNGDGYLADHACHFLIEMKTIRRYGWPIWYDHNFGDNEIVARAVADGLWYKSPFAILYHNHPLITGTNKTDSTYHEGSQQYLQDAKLFNQRRASNWKAL